MRIIERIKSELAESKMLFGFGFLKVLGLAAPLVIAKFFSEDMFGVYSLAKMVIFFFVTLLITTPQVPFVVFAGREKMQTGKINSSFSVQSVFFILGIVLYIVFAVLFNSYIRNFIGVSSGDLFYISIGFLGIALNFFIGNLFLALGQRIKNSLAECTFGIITLVIVAVLCLSGRLNLRTVFSAYFVSSLLVLAIFFKIIDFSLLGPFHFDFGRFKEMFDFTKWIIAGAVATFFIDWGDNFILKIFKISMANIGQYNLAYQIFNGVITLIYILNSYFLPFISENIGNNFKIREYLFSKRPRIFAFGFVFLAAGFVVCPFFFKIVYPGAYQDSVLLLRILLIGCAFVLYNTFYIPLLNALRLYRFSQTAGVAIMIIKLILNTLLVSKYGFYGAAVGTVISYICMTIIYECYYRFKMKLLLQ